MFLLLSIRTTHDGRGVKNTEQKGENRKAKKGAEHNQVLAGLFACSI